MVKEAAQALGVSYSSTIAPRCELHKLLLYETGSHANLCRSTEKEPGIFATVIVTLPSQYAGGQIRVSHGTKKTTFDTAASSAVSFTLFAWYSDEVKPITVSGLRCRTNLSALHATRSRPPSPTLTPPSQSLRQSYATEKKVDTQTMSTDCLHSRPRIFEQEPEAGVVKSVDVHLVGILRVADMDSGDTQRMYRGGGKRWNQGEFTWEDFYDAGDTKLKHVVTLDGNPVAASNFTVEEEDVMPKAVFQDMDPDYTEYAGYMGNDAGDTGYLQCILARFRQNILLNLLPVSSFSVPLCIRRVALAEAEGLIF
ncbi:hypothetical protein B0H19DRAFT_1077371 [Mycena capillaripes]|nr:hypothetical protein B0H19DRAFT_1077371 [Mycena capillaripes]